MAFAALARRPSAAAQDLGDARAGVFQRRHQAEEQPRQQGNRQREPERAAVDADLVQARQRRGASADEDSQAGVRERQAQQAAGASEDRALDQQPADDPSPAGAEGRTHRQLLLPPFGPYEQQAGDVGAGDEHHDPDRSHQHPQRSRDVADDVLRERTERRRDAPGLVDARVDGWRGGPRRHPDRHHARHIGAGVRDRDPRLQPRHGLQPEARQRQAAAVDPERHDEVGLDVDDAEPFGHDADDLARARLNRDASSDDGAIAAEAAPPITVAEHHDARRTRDLIGGRQRASEHRLDAERRERAVGRPQAAHLLRLGDAGDGRRPGKPDADVLEGAIVLGVREVHRWREAEVAGQVRHPGCARGGVPDRDQAVWLRVGQRPEKHAVDDAEDGGVGADADGQRQEDHGGERRRPAKRAHAVPQVAPHVIEPGQAPLIAQGVHTLRHGPVAEHRRASGSGLRPPSGVFGRELEMRAQLFFHVRITAARADRAPEADDPLPQSDDWTSGTCHSLLVSCCRDVTVTLPQSAACA